MPTITPEISQEIEELRQRQQMMGMDPFQSAPAGGDAMQYLASLWFGGGAGHDFAPQLAEKLGISPEQFNSTVTDINQRTASKPHGIAGAISGIGNYASEHPAVYLAPLALGALGGAFGAGAGTGVGTSTASAGVSSGGAIGAGTGGGGTLAGLGGGGLSGSALGAGGAAGAASSLAPGLGLGAGTAAGAGGAMAGANWLNWANLGSTVLGVVGANKAADAQVDSSGRAIAESGRQFDLTRGDLKPVIDLGGDAATRLKQYNSGDMSGFFNSPDYAYNVGESQKAIDRFEASRGKFNSGQAGKELVRNAAGLAAGQSGAFTDRLLAAAGLGTTGAATSANAGANSAALSGNANMAAGNARASGYGNAYGALQGGIQNLLTQRYLGL